MSISHSIVVQFLMQGFGNDDDNRRRAEIEEVVSGALSDGENTGGDGGSGTMNSFFSVEDPARAREPVLEAMREAGLLEPGLVVVHQTFREDEDGETEIDEIWWPEDYAFGFSTFGPHWKGVPGKAELDGLSEGVRSLQGQWRVVRYDTPDGSDASAWASELRFLIARDQLLVRRSMAVISAASIQIDVEGEIDLQPIMGPNRGATATGRYELRDGVLHFCMVPPGEDRPDEVAADDEHQPGRMILRREPE